MNGAQSLLQTLVNQGVDTCFTNPGTSEMHFVSAIGAQDRMRAVLCLFEGVATGAADGFGRIAGRPACTLLHLGPGLGNGIANLHNARKARSPVINLVGDHATWHRGLDAPLTSDIQGLAAPVSHWTASATTAAGLPELGRQAVQAAATDRIATLIVPADCAWDESVDPLPGRPLPLRPSSSASAIQSCARRLASGRRSLLLLAGEALSLEGLELADRIAQATGAELFHDTFSTRIARGAGSIACQRLGYFAEQAQPQLAGFQEMILVGTKAPVAFFAYPGRASEFTPEGCNVEVLARPEEDLVGALAALADELDARQPPRRISRSAVQPATGALTAEAVGRALAHWLPENTIVVDESATSGLHSFELTAQAAPHDWLLLTGGSIGFGLPTALGAALAAPERKVVCLQGDGGAMYTIQALWTMAREGADVVTIVFSNRKYMILQIELARVGAQTMTQKALDLLDLSKPDLDFVQLARGMGVRADRAGSAEALNRLFERAARERGPWLIEAVLAG